MQHRRSSSPQEPAFPGSPAETRHKQTWKDSSVKGCMFRVEGYELRKHEKPQREKRLERKLIARMPGPNSPPSRMLCVNGWSLIWTLTWLAHGCFAGADGVLWTLTWLAHGCFAGTDRVFVDVNMVGTQMLFGNGRSLGGR